MPLILPSESEVGTAKSMNTENKDKRVQVHRVMKGKGKGLERSKSFV